MTAADGRVVGTTTIVDNGPGNERWDLVVLGDGYREAELDDYHGHVDTFVATFLATPPFPDSADAINVHRVDIVSTDGGARRPSVDGDCASPPRTPRTFLDAQFCTPFFGTPLERLLTVDTLRALQVATVQVPLRNQVLVIVNSAKYGGSGGAVAVCSTNAPEIAIHEMGHSAFGLADEYGGNGTGTPIGEPPQPNATRDPQRATNKWATLVDPATPMPTACNGSCVGSTCVPPATPAPAGVTGAFEGAVYADCNLYRPAARCYMRDYGPFCAVCRAAITATLAPFRPSQA